MAFRNLTCISIFRYNESHFGSYSILSIVVKVIYIKTKDLSRSNKLLNKLNKYVKRNYKNKNLTMEILCPMQGQHLNKTLFLPMLIFKILHNISPLHNRPFERKPTFLLNL